MPASSRRSEARLQPGVPGWGSAQIRLLQAGSRYRQNSEIGSTSSACPTWWPTVRIRPSQGLRFTDGVSGVLAGSDGLTAESYSGEMTKYARSSAWRVEDIPGQPTQDE